MREVELALGHDLDEPARARAFAAEHLVGLPDATRHDVLLLVSELVSNVVLHGAPPARLVLRVDGIRVHVLVEDSSPALPEGPGRRDKDAPSGRGLVILAAVAASWGISTPADRPGKCVWFDVAVGV